MLWVTLKWLLVVTGPALHPFLDGWDFAHSLDQTVEEREVVEHSSPALRGDGILQIDDSEGISGINHAGKELKHLDVRPAQLKQKFDMNLQLENMYKM